MATHQLDTKGLLCPIPVIKTQNRIKDLQPGDLLEVVCTDPGALHDIPAWCRIHGHTVVDTHEGSEIIITVRIEA